MSLSLSTSWMVLQLIFWSMLTILFSRVMTLISLAMWLLLWACIYQWKILPLCHTFWASMFFALSLLATFPNASILQIFLLFITCSPPILFKLHLQHAHLLHFMMVLLPPMLPYIPRFLGVFSTFNSLDLTLRLLSLNYPGLCMLLHPLTRVL